MNSCAVTLSTVWSPLSGQFIRPDTYLAITSLFRNIYGKYLLGFLGLCTHRIALNLNTRYKVYRSISPLYLGEISSRDIRWSTRCILQEPLIYVREGRTLTSTILGEKVPNPATLFSFPALGGRVVQG